MPFFTLCVKHRKVRDFLEIPDNKIETVFQRPTLDLHDFQT